MLSLEQFDKLTSGIQHVVTAAGIMIGGLWVLYTFWGQHVLQKANLDVAKTEREIRKIEQDSLEQPVLRSIIRPGTIAGDGHLASITVTLRNEGKLALSFYNSALLLKKISHEAGTQAGESQPIQIGAKIIENGAFVNMPPRVLRTGQERSIAFVLPELAAGAYFVELRTDYDGLKIVDGRFEKSSDETIGAVDQAVLSLPIRASAQGVISEAPKE